MRFIKCLLLMLVLLALSAAALAEQQTVYVMDGSAGDGSSPEQAVGTLAGLSEGNRLVGIISHVSELKEKIDRQIVVTREKTGGSYVKIHI